MKLRHRFNALLIPLVTLALVSIAYVCISLFNHDANSIIECHANQCSIAP